MTAREIDTAARALVAALRAPLASAADVASLSQLPDATLGVLRGALSQARTSAAALLAELYAADPAEGVTGGEAVLAALTWQHELTAALIRLDAAVATALDQLETARRTRRRRRAIARAGDTWARLAARELGDYRRADELVELNGAEPASAPLGEVWIPT